MSEEFERCPFCGREAYLDDELVCCTGGEACVTGFLSKSPEEWNTRPIEDELRTEIAALQAQTRWIPVSERLPMDIDEQYLTLSTNSEVFIMFWNEYWYSPFDENGDESCINVTHWMQLPIPPRDGE